MALSDKTQFDDRIAATFSTIPSKYPPLPSDVLSRFPSLEEWQKDQSRLIARVKEALDSMGSDLGIPLNKAQVAQELLSKTVATQYDELSARITTENTLLVDETQALAQRTTTIESTINTPTTGLLARINVVETTYATKDYATAKKEEAITAAVNSANTYTVGQISSLASVYATPSYVETKKTEAITAAVTSANSNTSTLISLEQTARSTADTSLASRASALESTVNTAGTGLTARIGVIETTYATKDYATAKKEEAISAAVASANSYTAGQISSLSSVYATPTQVTSTVNSIISASVGSTSGTIGAAIETERQARATADGNLSGKYTLKVTAGNVVTGMNITSSTGTGSDVSSITFLASEFKIYNSATGIAPFSVIGGVIYAQNMVIDGTLLVSGSIAASRLNFIPVSSTNVVASINATAEGIQISGSRIQISGSTTFSSGYDPSTKLAPGSAAGDVNSNTTTINGGKITANSITADKIVTAGLSLTSSQVSGLGTLATQNTVSNSQVTGLGSLASLSTIGTSYITGLAATATNSDFSAITGTTKPANNADVSLNAINGGLYITSGGLTLAGSGPNAASIRSQNYVLGTSGWAIAANGDVEFASGTFRGSITGATGTFKGTVNIGSGYAQTQIDASGLRIGSVEFNASGITTVLKTTPTYNSNRGMILSSGAYDSYIKIGYNLESNTESLGFFATTEYAAIRQLEVFSGLSVTGGNLSVTNSATINGNTYSGSFSSNGNGSFNTLNIATSASIRDASFSATSINLHPSSDNSMGGGEDGGTDGATTGAYISIRYNGRQVWIPFFTTLP
jgi:hypothetical protein